MGRPDSHQIDQTYPLHGDLVWIASDDVDHVGAFVTASLGPIPRLAFDRSQPPLETIENAVLGLPGCTVPAWKVGEPTESLRTFVALAERGLYVFDWNYKQAYEAVVTPMRPTCVGQLPEPLRTAARAHRCSCDFSKLRVVDVRRFFACATRE